MQPTAQAVGRKQRMIQLPRSERIPSVSSRKKTSSDCKQQSKAPNAETGAICAPYSNS